MKHNIILRKDRLRRIPSSFTWVDHRIWRDGYLTTLNATDLRLYLFLLLVGDRHGVSYWGDKSICAQLQIRPGQLNASRVRLVELSMVAYRLPYYQVLSLQDKCDSDDRAASSQIGDIIENVLTGNRANRTSRGTS